MRIGLVTPPWLTIPPKGYGGLETVVDHLARGLDAAGHEVLLCAPGDSTCPVLRYPTIDQAIGVGSFGPRWELGAVTEAYRALVEWEPDVVHDHSQIGPAVGWDWTGLRIVTTNHATFDPTLSSYYRWLADVAGVPIVAISHDQAASAEAERVPIVDVIHHGVDVDALPLGDGDGGYVLWLGRFNPCKGPDVAIDVALEAGIPIRLAAKSPNVTEIDYFRAEIQPRLCGGGGQVEYVGEITGDEKSELLGGACCLLNPIQWPEPFGMVMIEALAHGTPVVATFWGSVPELITQGETGWLCDNIDDLTAAVQACAAGRIDRARCRKAAERRFSTEVMIDHHETLYEKLVAR
jgi:glycosyltransferase involved in cell wall biosynthesis